MTACASRRLDGAQNLRIVCAMFRLVLPIALSVFAASACAFAEALEPNAEAVAAYDQILATVKPGQQTIALGDMIVPIETVRLWRDRLAGVDHPLPESASQTGVNEWTGGNVYYAFNANVSAAHRVAFLDGAREWETFANLHFIARTAEANYIMVNDGGPGLSGGNSAVGMIGGVQQLNIGSSSWNRPTIVHELGHAIGLIHEHQRSDRDTFVTINFSNVPGGMTNGNFIVIPTSTNNGAYDFLSVMHYGRKTLAVNPAIDTITPKPPYLPYIDVMGGLLDRVLSRGDRDGIAVMYEAGPAQSTVVTNTKDSGPGSLRAAIYRALDIATDAPGATPMVSFQIANTDPNFSGGVFTIRPTDRMTAPGPGTTIDGATQTAFTGDTNASGPEIVLNGALQNDPSTYGLGLRLTESNITIRGLVINGFSTQGILVTGGGATGCTVAGCYIGTNAAGTATSANTFSGIEINAGATSNRIGGTTAATRNVISGNASQGIALRDAGTTGNSIEGNYIGTNAAGTAALANGTAFHFAGVEISNGANANTVGGTAAGARNVISGNTGQGVAIIASNGNVVAGNFIGTNAAGSGAIPNTYAGAEIFGGAQFNMIGGTTVAARNILSGNASQGAAIDGAGTSNNVIAGNYAGLNAAGTAALPNAYAGAEIFGGATGNTIGGTVAGSGNVLSGNLGQGVALTGAGTSGNVVAGNHIGTNPGGTAAIGNGTPASRNSGVGIFSSASGNTIGGDVPGARNLISGNTGQGIFIAQVGTNNNVVAGNWIGLNASGSGFVRNAWSGVEIGAGGAGGGPQNNTIGGPSTASRNVISGNGIQGVYLNGTGTSSNVVAGNYIGLNAAGAAAIGNLASGVELSAGFYGSPTANTIGSTTGGRNFISGNVSGIQISGSGTNANVIVGNTIGMSPSGAVIANGDQGIVMFDGPQGNTIGGATPGASNLIAGNTASGIALFDASTTGNRISGNSIFGNGQIGINLFGGTQNGAGVTTNDSADGDTGPNNCRIIPCSLPRCLARGRRCRVRSTAHRTQCFALSSSRATRPIRPDLAKARISSPQSTNK